MNKKNWLAIIFALLSMVPFPSLAATYAPWLTQIGITDQAMSESHRGSGLILGIVDSGIATTSPAFAQGQILTDLSDCAAKSFDCSKGFYDNNGHGTAVAEIAAGHTLLPFKTSHGGYVTRIDSQLGVAPDAKIIAEKVLDKSGRGYSSDIAYGIRKAVDAGASVINVSISYSNAFDTVSALNYAAAKDVFVVWAGGNESESLMEGRNTPGLTPAAVNHLIFAGSVSASNTLSTFSNTPGKGALTDTTGGKKTYASRWAMAPGEDIVAHDIRRGTKNYYYWTGTSMSAPLISGALLLLEDAWPILKTNGTAANLLLDTATSLGDSAIYGHGLINLTNALNKPKGILSLKLADGSAVPLENLNQATVLSDALGSQPAVRAKLARYTSFDHYTRDFAVNLSELLAIPSMRAKLNPLPSKPNAGVQVARMQDGSELSYRIEERSEPTQLRALGSEYAMQVDTAGNAQALGYGFPVQFSYAKALFANEEWAKLSSDLGISSLANLAQGGGLAVYGMNVNDATRVAMSWSNLVNNKQTLQADACNVNLGLTRQINNFARLGINYSFLNENNGLLGSVYAPDAVLNFGANNKSNQLAFSALLHALPNSKLLFEAALSATKGGAASGLLIDTRAIRSRSVGVSLMENALFRNDDSLVISIKQPLRIASGEVGFLIPGVDARGVPVFSTEYINLAPDGREMDYKISYDRPIGKMFSLSLQAVYYIDLGNIRGKNDANIGLAVQTFF